MAIGADQSVSAFRSGIGQQDLLGSAVRRIQYPTTTAAQYQQAVAQFQRHPIAPGQLLTWVCHDNAAYLDLTTDRLEMTPDAPRGGETLHAEDNPEGALATPNWQPLSMLPTIAMIIDGELESVEEQQTLLRRARGRPHVLDDDTVHRVIRLSTAQLEFVPHYREQLARWRAASPTRTQRDEISRMSAQLERHETILKDLLALAKEA